MLKFLLVIPSSASQKIAHYSYFILLSLPIIPILFFMLFASGIDIQRSMDLMHSLWLLLCKCQ